MTWEETIDFWAAYDYYTRSGEQRKGQAMMNALWNACPELYQEVTGSLADCFYQDERIPAFKEMVGL